MNPKAFLSYSWSNVEHEMWVLDLATQLTDAGVHVILDKWDLKEGQDAHAFMESMVSDESIKKVILICDKIYANKADSRTGGVGAESQIITPEIYGKKEQSKFVAVVRERDESGEPYLPRYYKSRIYIDLSNAASYSDNFEKLVRWVYDKPLYVRPEFGSKPSYLTESSSSIRLTTSAAFMRAIDAMKSGKNYALAAIQDYFSILSQEFEKFRLDPNSTPFDDAIFENIKGFLPYRDEAITLISIMISYFDNEDSRTVLHRFFESILPYQNRPSNIMTYKDWDWDNYAFMLHELFLHTFACCLKNEKFEAACHLVENEYHQPVRSDYGHPPMAPYLEFRTYLKSFEARDRRLQLRRLSLRADILKERCNGAQVNFHHLMQADFALYLRSKTLFSSNFMWWPETLVYYGSRGSTFEIFSRAASRRYFDKIKGLIGVETKDELGTALDRIETEQRGVPRWQFDSINPRYICQFDLLATKP